MHDACTGCPQQSPTPAPAAPAVARCTGLTCSLALPRVCSSSSCLCFCSCCPCCCCCPGGSSSCARQKGPRALGISSRGCRTRGSTCALRCLLQTPLPGGQGNAHVVHALPRHPLTLPCGCPAGGRVVLREDGLGGRGGCGLPASRIRGGAPRQDWWQRQRTRPAAPKAWEVHLPAAQQLACVL